jgi:1,4-dihydroxy-2-naphthoyl-CoA hydrolase
MLWKQKATLEGITQISANTLTDHLDIQFTTVGDDFLEAEMPVTHKTVQPMRILHGGASVVLAETLGSIASILCVDDPSKQQVVGVEINANHLKGVPEGGKVTGRVTAIRVGKTIHVWQIDIRDEKGHLTCTSRLTVMVITR